MMTPQDYEITGDPEIDLPILRKLHAAQIAAMSGFAGDPESGLAGGNQVILRQMVDKPTRSGEVPSLTEDPQKVPYTPLTVSAGNALPLAAMLMGNPATMLGRMATNAAIGGTSEALKGGGPEDIAKVGIGSGLLGGALEKAGEGLRYVGSAIPKKMFDVSQEAKLTQLAQERVPWWQGLSLKDMAFGTKGKDALQKGYDDAFMAARGKIPEEAVASLPEETARLLKLKGARAEQASAGTLGAAEQAGASVQPGDILVSARELLDKMPGSTGAIRRQIMASLREIGADVIPEAQASYMFGRGLQEMANRGGLGKGPFDAQKAQAALTKPMKDESLAQKVLQPRGMQEVEDLVQGPLSQPITSRTPPYWGWHGGMGILGALAGYGSHGIPGLSAGLAAAIPRPTFYRNVPAQIPQIGQAGRAALSATMPGFLSNMLSTEPD